MKTRRRNLLGGLLGGAASAALALTGAVPKGPGGGVAGGGEFARVPEAIPNPLAAPAPESPYQKIADLEQAPLVPPVRLHGVPAYISDTYWLPMTLHLDPRWQQEAPARLAALRQEWEEQWRGAKTRPMLVLDADDDVFVEDDDEDDPDY